MIEFDTDLICLFATQRNHPTMAAYAALVSLTHIIDNLQLHPHPPISLSKTQLHLLTPKLTFLLEFLECYNPLLPYATEADPFERRIADAAHTAEDVIESHIVDRITNDDNFSSDVFDRALEKAIEEMALIEKEAVEIGVRNQLNKVSTPSNSLSPSSIAQKISMVGADDVKLQLMDKLTADCRDLQIIPVVGMAGTGKTTLCRNIYGERFIKEHFYIRAWATISQEYSILEIFIAVLRQLKREFHGSLSEDKLGEMVYQYLFGRKYLIIMDDMWSTEAWDRVRRYFPDNKNGSRIVVTTRLSNLAIELAGSNSVEMRLLDEANSWDLLS